MLNLFKSPLPCQAMLRDAGLEPYVPEGSFFIMANTDAFEVPASYLETPTASCPKMTPDWAFCRCVCSRD